MEWDSLMRLQFVVHRKHFEHPYPTLIRVIPRSLPREHPLLLDPSRVSTTRVD